MGEPLMIGTIFSVLVFVILLEYLGGMYVKSRLKSRLLASSAGKLVLTFDDGPGDWLEGRLLTLLEREEVRVTFFVHSGRALKQESLAQRLKNSGHEIAIHTSTHINVWKTFPWKLLLDFKAALKELKPTATNTRLYRPPFGKLTLSTWLYLRLIRTELAFWTVDSGDTWSEIPESRKIVNAISEANGGVVLLHSHDRESGPDRKAEKFVLEVTEALIGYAKENDLKISCFSEMS